MARPVRWWVGLLGVVLACGVAGFVVLHAVGFVLLVVFMWPGEPIDEPSQRSAPVTVAIGEAFVVDGLEVGRGWRLYSDPVLDATTVVGLSVLDTPPARPRIVLELELDPDDSYGSTIGCAPVEPAPRRSPEPSEPSATPSPSVTPHPSNQVDPQASTPPPPVPPVPTGPVLLDCDATRALVTVPRTVSVVVVE